MKSRSSFVVVISFVLALVLAVSVYSYLNALKEQGTKITQYDTIVSSVEIPQYTKITADMVVKSKVTVLPMDSTSYYSNATDVVGKYAKEKILKGEQFYKSRVLENSEGNPALTLSGSNRAISVMANLESGVAKLLKTGDRLDILVSLPEIKEETKIIRPELSKIILQNIMVLAVDQNTSTSESAASTADNNSDGKAGSTGTTAENIFYLTLSVPVSDIEKIALAENIGRLKFALRPKGDNTIYPTDGTIWQEMLERAEASAKPPTPATVSAPATVSTPPVVKQSQYTYYVVKYGDTLMNIARTTLHDPSQYKLLQKINNIADPSLIRPGTRIKIPVTK